MNNEKINRGNITSLRHKKTDRSGRRVEFLASSSEMKDEMVERSKSGFGRQGYGMSNMMRYSYLHIDDGNGIDLDDVEELVETIVKNRPLLDKMNISYEEFLREVGRIGNNINQTTRKINLQSLIASEEGTPEYELGKILLELSRDIRHEQDVLRRKVLDFITTMSDNRDAIKVILEKEDELLTRCISLPHAGDKKHQYGVLIRKIQDYVGDDIDQYLDMPLSSFLYELKEKYNSNK